MDFSAAAVNSSQLAFLEVPLFLVCGACERHGETDVDDGWSVLAVWEVL